MRRWQLAAIGIVVAIVILGVMSMYVPTPAGQVAAVATPTPEPTPTPGPTAPGPLLDGDKGRIGSGGAGEPCMSSKEKLDEATQAATNHDDEGWREATADALMLDKGTHVLAIGHDGFMMSLIHIRVLDGPEAGAACWFPSDLENLFE